MGIISKQNQGAVTGRQEIDSNARFPGRLAKLGDWEIQNSCFAHTIEINRYKTKYKDMHRHAED